MEAGELSSDEARHAVPLALENRLVPVKVRLAL
jgi:hypothetical protein